MCSNVDLTHQAVQRSPAPSREKPRAGVNEAGQLGSQMTSCQMLHVGVRCQDLIRGWFVSLESKGASLVQSGPSLWRIGININNINHECPSHPATR